MSNEKEVFNKLYHKNVNEFTVKKRAGNTELTYLSWADAWAQVKLEYPDAEYKIKKFENNLPYVYDEQTGYMVFTEVTIQGQTHEMWLPVMDHNNLAMKHKPYEKKFKYSTAKVDAATMFDINKSIMRCLTKNLAMFGLGLYIYAGEDLPEEPPVKKINDTQVKSLKVVIEVIAKLTDQTPAQATKALLAHQELPNNIKELDENQYGTFLRYLNSLKQEYEKRAKEKQAKEKKVEVDDGEQDSLFEGNSTKPKQQAK